MGYSQITDWTHIGRGFSITGSLGKPDHHFVFILTCASFLMTQSPTTFLHLKSFHSSSDALISYSPILLTEFFKKFFLIYLADLDFCFYARAFSLVAASAGFSPWWLLLLWSTGSRCWASVDVAHRLSCPSACGIFPDRGLNSRPLYWQVDSQSLDHWESPTHGILPSLSGLNKYWLFSEDSVSLQFFWIYAFFVFLISFTYKHQVQVFDSLLIFQCYI